MAEKRNGARHHGAIAGNGGLVDRARGSGRVNGPDAYRRKKGVEGGDAKC
ncbi:hypothetical protein [Curtanaerobium respiraculi]|nr:hypothetical protein [Curtanaerobium respiraculi]